MDKPFPTERLAVKETKAQRRGPFLDVTVKLTPFALDVAGEVQQVDTSAVFDGIDLGGANLADLVGSTTAFPLNPEDGYVDGSIYLYHAHHPVDLLQIRFETPVDGIVPARARARMVLSFEGLPGYLDTDWSFDMALPVDCVSA